jgi:hypothetical protein
VPDGDGQTESEDEKRERVMRRLAEILRQPPPSSGSGRGPVAAGSFEAAIGSLGLGLSEADTEEPGGAGVSPEEAAGALRQGPDPEEAAALLEHLLQTFAAWRRPSSGGDDDDEESGQKSS